MSAGALLNLGGKALNVLGLAIGLPQLVGAGADLADKALPGLGRRRVQQLLDQAGKSAMRGAIPSFLDSEAVSGESAFLDLLERRKPLGSFGANAGQKQVFDKALMDSLMSDNESLLRSITTRYEPPAQQGYLARALAELPQERIL